MVKSAKSCYNRNHLTENKNNPRTFWKIIKSIFPGSKPKTVQSSVTFFNENDLNNDLRKANTSCNHFSNIATRLKEKSLPLCNFVWKQTPSIRRKTDQTFKFKYVSKIFVEKQLRELKRHKATDIDELPANLLKDCSSEISYPLSFIINLSLRTGVIPSEWKTAIVTPLHKSGDKDDAGNYRPISVLPVLSKIMEKAVNLQVVDFLESNILLSNNQFGYRK